MVAAAADAAWFAGRIGVPERVARAAEINPGGVSAIAAIGGLAIIAAYAEDHFPLLMLATVMLYATVALGLNIQFGYAGLVNFAGAAFFGIGAYTSAKLVGSGVPAARNNFV